MEITNVKSNYTYCKEVVKTIDGRIRKKLIVMDVSGKTVAEKRKLISDKLLKAYGAIPDGITFSKRKTKDKHNPDGYRIFVVCEWINRNRFYDDKGEFKIGTLMTAINKQIDGQTKKQILKIGKHYHMTNNVD